MTTRSPFVRPVLLLLLLFPALLPGQERFYYKGRTFGSEALYNPLYLILNASYDIIQMENRSREIFSLPYGSASANVFRNLGDPFKTINTFGTWEFVRREVLPLSWKVGEAQWWPNYQLHLIGGGMTYVAMKEWYEAHGVAAPALWSIGTMATYHLLNEIVENGDFVGPTVDPIADIYLFDIGGIILFSFDGVNELFGRELRMADWSLQPSFVPGPWTLQNNGQYFSIRWKFPFAEQYSLFYCFGLRGLVGASRDIGDGESISAGFGMRAVQLKTLDPTTNLQTVELRFNAGLFYDRDNSLLASLMLSDYADNAVTLNIYPGIVKFGGFTPGLWLLWSKNDGFIVGFTTVWAPGLGVRLQ